ncbi:MAG: hypothetical protein IPP06_13110 [Saprospiraceae bacterium]|nr:hypothetical protein [Candidatus Vicinibacter affinis]MBP6173440.1 hypothetical protein [Saprospiraceae bacterium]MBK6572474.1 hypothetical protein [Candidatus Vicinibacter affinis]MBK6825277.1 hypothetical protein [Candidatus Vicinibacter affinis]MBK7304257.1 hypothetical protein [Candidatus Vicinibacter affinis]
MRPFIVPFFYAVIACCIAQGFYHFAYGSYLIKSEQIFILSATLGYFMYQKVISPNLEHGKYLVFKYLSYFVLFISLLTAGVSIFLIRNYQWHCVFMFGFLAVFYHLHINIFKLRDFAFIKNLCITCGWVAAAIFYVAEVDLYTAKNYLLVGEFSLFIFALTLYFDALDKGNDQAHQHETLSVIFGDRFNFGFIMVVLTLGTWIVFEMYSEHLFNDKTFKVFIGTYVLLGIMVARSYILNKWHDDIKWPADGLILAQGLALCLIEN